MIPWRFLKRFSCFATTYQRHAKSRVERDGREFSERPWQIDRIERGPIDWHIILMAVRVIARTRSEPARRESRSNLFGPACPTRPCSIIATRRCKCATIYEIERVYPGDTAIPWIKFRVAVNLDHLLRHGKHNFKLSFANKHGPWRAERFLLVPNKFFPSPPLAPALSTTDGGFEKSYLCVTFRKLLPLSILFVRRSHAIFRNFSLAQITRDAIIERWKLYWNLLWSSTINTASNLISSARIRSSHATFATSFQMNFDFL